VPEALVHDDPGLLSGQPSVLHELLKISVAEVAGGLHAGDAGFAVRRECDQADFHQLYFFQGAPGFFRLGALSPFFGDVADAQAVDGRARRHLQQRVGFAPAGGVGQLPFDLQADAVFGQAGPDAHRRHVVGANAPAAVLHEHGGELAGLVRGGQRVGKGAGLDHVAVAVDVAEDCAVAAEHHLGSGGAFGGGEFDFLEPEGCAFNGHGQAPGVVGAPSAGAPLGSVVMLIGVRGSSRPSIGFRSSLLRASLRSMIPAVVSR